MTLSEWLGSKGDCARLAALLGVDNSTVWRWANHKRTPSPEIARQIEDVTDGAVKKEELLWPPEEAA